MDKIQMVDLKSQYLKIKNEIDNAMADVINSTAFINGPQVNEFASQLAAYLQVKHVIPCANGTDALQIAMMALDLKPGDEVITPSFTYIATVEVVGLLGLKPVFCEVDKDTFTMNVADMESKITSKTKAIVPVHLYGQSANMEAILEVAKKHNLYVIEDTAQAIGGTYTFSDGNTIHNGCMGTIGTTSFFPSKNLGCYGDGGAIYTNNDDLAIKLKMIANHGQKQKYVHDIMGCNSRLDTLQAAILKIKLQHLDEYCNARRAVADYYDMVFANHPNIQTPYRAQYSKHVFHQYTLILNNVDRNEVQKELEKVEIPSMIYYPIPAHKQKVFATFLSGETLNMPVTDWLTERVISLPIHTEMSNEHLQYITTNFINIINKLSK